MCVIKTKRTGSCAIAAVKTIERASLSEWGISARGIQDASVAGLFFHVDEIVETASNFTRIKDVVYFVGRNVGFSEAHRPVLERDRVQVAMQDHCTVLKEVFVVANDGEWNCSANGPRAEVAQRIDDSKEFLIIDFVINFCGGEFP